MGVLVFIVVSFLLLQLWACSSFPLPPRWDRAVLFSQLPVNKNGTRVLNPWIYENRLGIFRELIERTNKRYTCLFDDTYTNVIWGLPLQFGWQFDSQRLDLSEQNQSKVSSHSWWADMNYLLSVIPFLGANKSDTLGIENILVEAPEDAPLGMFCTEYSYSAAHEGACANVSDALSAWSAYFTSLPALEGKCRNGKKNESDAILTNLWRAHTASLEAGLSNVPYINNQLSQLSQPESLFGVSWANLVDFLAEAKFRPDFNGTARMQVLLPMRKLRKGERAPHIKNMSQPTNNGIFMIETLARLNRLSRGLLLEAWAYAMCAPKARQEAQVLIFNGITNPKIIIPGILKIIEDAVATPRDPKCHAKRVATGDLRILGSLINS